MTNTPKVVFSKYLKVSPWVNSTITHVDFVEEINRLKLSEGKDIITYGEAGFASQLIMNVLINEYHLFSNPTIIGKGFPIFRELVQSLTLNLVHSISFECGIVVLCNLRHCKHSKIKKPSL